MPEDMNHYGFLFGGKMLMWIDFHTDITFVRVDESGNKMALCEGDKP